MKKLSWKEAPVFHFVWVIICAVCLFRCIIGYVERFGSDGWANEWLTQGILFALLTWYFVAGVNSGLGEAEAVEDSLKKKGD